MSANIYWAHEAKSYTYIKRDNNNATTNTVRLLTSTTAGARYVSSIICHNRSSSPAEVTIGICYVGTLTLATTAIINQALIPGNSSAILSDIKSPIFINQGSGLGNRDLVFNSGTSGEIAFTVTYHEFADNNGF
jgi:hypothetical protein